MCMNLCSCIGRYIRSSGRIHVFTFFSCIHMYIHIKIHVACLSVCVLHTYVYIHTHTCACMPTWIRHTSWYVRHPCIKSHMAIYTMHIHCTPLLFLLQPSFPFSLSVCLPFCRSVYLPKGYVSAPHCSPFHLTINTPQTQMITTPYERDEILGPC